MHGAAAGFLEDSSPARLGSDPEGVGDASCYIALDTQLVTAWHLGKRDVFHTCRFVWKVRRATSCKRYQISTDSWEAYERAIEMGLSDRARYARIVKVTGKDRLEAVLGRPDLRETGTSYIERYNSTLREWSARFLRRRYSHSKKWEILEAMLALNVAHYNFCRIQSTLRVTPTMAAGLTGHPVDDPGVVGGGLCEEFTAIILLFLVIIVDIIPIKH